MRGQQKSGGWWWSKSTEADTSGAAGCKERVAAKKLTMHCSSAWTEKYVVDGR